MEVTRDEYPGAPQDGFPGELPGTVRTFFAQEGGSPGTHHLLNEPCLTPPKLTLDLVLLVELVEPQSTMARFHHFAAAEAQHCGGDISMLVHPSGSLQDPLGAVLHYPTIKTEGDSRNGQIRDLLLGSCCITQPTRPRQTSGTVRLGISSPHARRNAPREGVPELGCLWLDTYARRQGALHLGDLRSYIWRGSAIFC